MNLSTPIHDFLDALVHQSARGDALTAERHLAFMVPRLFASLIALGAFPVFLALFALAVPPIITNTYTAIRGVDPDVRQSAVGMGMTGWQVLTGVEIPNAIPLIFAGIRTAGVQTVATATLGAVVAWGGVGRYIVDGLPQRDYVKVVAGAFIVPVLSLLTEFGLAAVQRLATPAGLRKGGEHKRWLSTLPGAASTQTAPARAEAA